MQLSLRPLESVASVNNFQYVQTVSLTEGDSNRFYFQLVDPTQDTSLQQFKPAGRRFVPAAGATLQVTFLNIDDEKVITDRVASQPFVGDASIWYVDIAPTDPLRGTVSLVLKLTEGGKVTRARVNAVLAISSVGAF